MMKQKYKEDGKSFKCFHIGSNYAASRHSYHWLMTKHALVKKKIVADNDGAANTVEYYGDGFLQQLPNDTEAVLSNA